MRSMLAIAEDDDDDDDDDDDEDDEEKDFEAVPSAALPAFGTIDLDSTVTLRIVCDRLLREFMAVAAMWRCRSPD